MDLTPALRKKFLRFRAAYVREDGRLRAADVKGSELAKGPYAAALREVPLDPDELQLYRKLVAMQSVNGGFLFGNEDPS